MLTTADIARAIERIDGGIPPIRDALNAADRQLGDGDTGMTIAQVVGAWRVIAGELPKDVGEALLLLGRETGRASGSSLAAVLATGLSAAGRAVRGSDAVSRPAVATMLGAAAQKITERSGATPGAKTILDSLLQVQRDMSADDSQPYTLRCAVASTAAALDAFRSRESRLGRARMYGARSVGHDDPGMLAAHRLLDAAQTSSTPKDPT